MEPTSQQAKVIQSEADIVLIAGGRSAGKKWSALAALWLNYKNYNMSAVFSKGGIKSIKNRFLDFYPESVVDKYKIDFVNLFQTPIYNFAGKEYGVEVFIDLHDFSKNEFLYLQSRNRSNPNFKEKTYATIFPPHAPFWLKEFCQFWINTFNDGVLGYFIIVEGGDIIWGNSVGDVVSKIPARLRLQKEKMMPDLDWNYFVKSVTMITL